MEEALQKKTSKSKRLKTRTRENWKEGEEHTGKRRKKKRTSKKKNIGRRKNAFCCNRIEGEETEKEKRNKKREERKHKGI